MTNIKRSAFAVLKLILKCGQTKRVILWSIDPVLFKNPYVNMCALCIYWIFILFGKFCILFHVLFTFITKCKRSIWNEYILFFLFSFFLFHFFFAFFPTNIQWLHFRDMQPTERNFTFILSLSLSLNVNT